MSNLNAEILAIGDEIVSGARIDTNSAWLSQRLAEIGWQVVRHTTVPDRMDEIVAAMREAFHRAKLVIATGGLGPTADDLTRQALARATGVALERHEAIVDHIRSLFARTGRDMPQSNVVQADLPVGSRPIPNAYGTAPGIDMNVPARDGNCRIFCLPGVPAEMTEMWSQYVFPTITHEFGGGLVWIFHTLNCFGAGESHIESMLPGLIARGRQPQVGITASQATISLRIAACGADRQMCLALMQPTIDAIRQSLGDLIFSEGDATLADVVVSELTRRGQSIAVNDFFLGGDVGSALRGADRQGMTLAGSVFVPQERIQREEPTSGSSWLVGAARRAADEFGADWGLAIGPPTSTAAHPPRFDVALTTGEQSWRQSFFHAGHPSLIHVRNVKQVLNFARLTLRAAGG